MQRKNGEKRNKLFKGKLAWNFKQLKGGQISLNQVGEKLSLLKTI